MSTSRFNDLLAGIVLATGMLLSSCAGERADQTGDARDRSFQDVTSGKTDSPFDVDRGSAEAQGILNLVNSATFETLDKSQAVGLDVRAARHIVEHRENQRIKTLEALDQISWVGPRAFKKLYKYAQSNGFFKPEALSQACLNRIEAGETFSLDPSSPRGHLYESAIFDNKSGVWVTYTRPTQTSDNSAVFAAKIECNGKIKIGPKKISEADSGRAYGVAADVAGEYLYLAWNTETIAGGNTQTAQMQILHTGTGKRLFRKAKDVSPEAPNANESISPTVWQLDVAGLDNGGAVITGSYLTDRGEPRVFVQRIDKTGNLAGSVLRVDPKKDVRQVKPSITATSETRVYITWQRTEPGDPLVERDDKRSRDVVYRAVDLSNKDMGEVKKAGSFYSSQHSTPQLSSFAETDRIYLTYTNEGRSKNKIDLMNIGKAKQPIIDFGGSNVASRPNVAVADDNGGAVSWLVGEPSPAKGQLVLQGFKDKKSATMRKGSPLKVAENVIPSAGSGVTHIAEDTYFVTWSEGSRSLQSQIQGRFVQLK
jgi:DNA uptake protein ComE-like DNA-binding protein